MNRIKIGITGTREGATPGQIAAITEALKEYLHYEYVEFHHGDCVGVDIEVAAIARSLGFKVVCHPPIDDCLRGYTLADETRPPYGYMQRDRNIVTSCDVLFVVPLHNEPQPSGGTWYTHGYAVKVGRPIRMFYPKDCQTVDQ